MSLIGLFVRHPNAANLVMAMMLAIGLFAVLNLNTRFWPPAEVAEVDVFISWPGASAEDVSENILAAIEPEIRFLDGVEHVRSYAREGSSFTAIEFAPGTDMQKALGDVEQAIAGVTTLPQEAERPKISTETIRDPVAKLGVSGPFPEAALQVFARRIREDLLARGLEKVNINGSRTREILVEAREHDLIRLGVTTEDIASAIRENTVDRPSGVMDGAIDRQVRVIAGDETPRSIAAIALKSLPDGTTLTLSDVADVSWGFARNAVSGLRGGAPAIELVVQRTQSADSLQSTRLVQEYVQEARTTFPESLTIELYDVRTEHLWERISILVRAGWQGLAIVLIVLFLFLDSRVAFWVALGIPVAFAGTLGVMLATGQTINMLSLFALIMMLGVIVDDAIVVGEHADTLASRGVPLEQAAERGASEMLVPVLASSITSIVAFGPIFMMRDVIGQMMSALPLVSIAIILASLVECFLVLPGHLAHAWGRPSGLQLGRFLRLTVIAGLGAAAIGGLIQVATLVFAGNPPPWAVAIFDLPPILLATLAILVGLAGAGLVERKIAGGRNSLRPGPLGRFRMAFDRRFNAFRDGAFARFVSAAYAFRYTTLAVAVGTAMVVVIGLYWSGGHLKFVFFPSPEAESITTQIAFQAGTPRERAIKGAGIVEAALRATEADLAPTGETVVRDVYALIGRAGRDRGDNNATLFVQLTPSEERTVRTRDLIRAWRERVPYVAGIENVAIEEQRGGPPGRDVDVRLTGAAPSELKAAAVDVVAALETVAGVSGASDNLNLGKPELVLSLTPRGESLGFSREIIGSQLRGAFEGLIARRLSVGEEEVPVRVRLRASDGGAVPLEDLFLRSPAGVFVPLTEVADVFEQPTFSRIVRRDGVVSVTVTADVDSDVTTPQEVAEGLRASVLPIVEAKHGVRTELRGRDRDRRRSFQDLRQGAYLALFAIYVTLAFVFGSYWRPIVIMLIIPFGAVGAVLGHFIMGMNLTIVSFIGLLGLTGILVNDSIIMVRRFDERMTMLGESYAEAATGAAADRLRAVLLTSLTTIGGLIPLLFETSLAAQFLLPMAVTIVFGLSLATAIVLVLVPVLIGVGSDIGRVTETLIGRHGSTSAPTAP